MGPFSGETTVYICVAKDFKFAGSVNSKVVVGNGGLN